MQAKKEFAQIAWFDSWSAPFANFPWRKVALESLTVQQTGKQIDENIKSEVMF